MNRLKITAKAFLILCFAQFGMMAPIQVQANDNVGAALINLVGGIIVQGMAQEAAKKRNSRRSTQRKKVVNTQKRARAKRVQIALKTLGFYTKGIDGVWGRGSQGALNAYRVAFGLPSVKFSTFSEEGIFKLEGYASQGWRGQEEIIKSRNGGFTNRAEFVAARDAGFVVKSQWKEAESVGFDDNATFEAFKDSDFTSPEIFQLAVGGGFATEDDFNTAQEIGFSNAEEFSEFRASGHATKARFETAKKIRREGDKAAIQCEAASQEKDWFAADSACSVATKARPYDLSMKSFAAAAHKAVEIDHITVEQELAQAEALVASLLGQYENLDNKEFKAKLDAARANVKRLIVKNTFRKLHIDETACSVAVKLNEWDRANKICGDASIRASGYSAVDASSVELIDNLRKFAILAQVEVRAAEARAVIEREKLSVKSAKLRGRNLVDEVSAYSAGGKQFFDGLSVARKLVALRQVLELENSVKIEKAYSDLSGIVEVDRIFIADRMARTVAKEKSKTESAAAAKQGVGYVNEFLKSHIAKNFSAENIDQLLDLQAEMETALAQNNSVELASVLANAHSMLQVAKIKGDLDKFIAIFGSTSLSSALEAETLVKGIQIETLNDEAGDLVESVTAHSKSGGKFANPIGIARALVAVRVSLRKGDLEALIQNKERLEGLLVGEQSYQIANQKRQTATATSRKNAETLALEKARFYSDYLINFITENIASDSIGEALEFQEKFDAAIDSGDWKIVTPLNKAFKKFLISNGLTREFDTFVASHDGVNDQAADLELSSNGIVVNGANRVLLEGGAKDIIVLQNSISNSPNMSVSLLGKLVFDNNRAVYCWMHDPIEETTSTLMAERELNALGVVDLVDLELCDGTKDVDLIFIQRGAFLSLSALQANATIKAFEEGRLKPLVIITEADTLAFESGQGESAESLEAAINAEERTGFGIISLANGKGKICLSVDANEMALTNLLKNNASALAFYFDEPIEVTSVRLDRAFAMAQRNLCSGIYTNANGLRLLFVGLERERIEHTLLPLWIAEDDYAGEIANIERNNDDQLARLSDQRQKTIAAEKLARDVAETDENLRLARQVILREKNQNIATGEMKKLGDLTSEFLIQAYARSNGVRFSEFSELFPRLSAIVQGQVNNQWAMTSEKSTMVDYGSALWQGRRIGAILSEIRYDSQNVILGMYEQECAVIGYLIDDEFGLLRDAIDAPCDNLSTVDKWKISHEFRSGWFAE